MLDKLETFNLSHHPFNNRLFTDRGGVSEISALQESAEESKLYFSALLSVAPKRGLLAMSYTSKSDLASLNQYFERIVVINLPQRLDRRREMEAQLQSINLTAEFFPAIQPRDQGEWPSLGARGCFLSHYTVLKEALSIGSENVLFLEDDLDFSPSLPSFEAELIRQISSQPWDFLYLGHLEMQSVLDTGRLQLVPWSAGLRTTHFYAVNRSVLARLVAFLEQVMSRPDGHPLGGPQHIDGAYSMFRAQNPDVITLIANPVLGAQRSSRSDITAAWYDSVPGLVNVLNIARSVRRRVVQ